jgi:hypothetical protein
MFDCLVFAAKVLQSGFFLSELTTIGTFLCGCSVGCLRGDYLQWASFVALLLNVPHIAGYIFANDIKF